jgi:diaminopimelate epimerase
MAARLSGIPFVKASACGNDFLIIDGMHAPADMAAFTRRICERHDGVGADGVEWLFPDKEADIRARLFNVDGSVAEISGNGTRCVAAYIADEQKKEKIVIRTDAGLKTCMLTARNESRYEFETAMGEPQVKDEVSIKVASGEVRGIPVSMGNPHYVVFVREFSSRWQAEGAEIGSYQDFKQGMNVEFVCIKDKENIEVRFFERGVGETQSSGTGSCASAVAAIATNKVVSPVRVHAPGGVQSVRWDKEVFLRGPAQLICRGEYLP